MKKNNKSKSKEVGLEQMDVDLAYSLNKDTTPHHFHYYDSGMITFKKKYAHLYAQIKTIK